MHQDIHWPCRLTPATGAVLDRRKGTIPAAPTASASEHRQSSRDGVAGRTRWWLTRPDPCHGVYRAETAPLLRARPGRYAAGDDQYRVAPGTAPRAVRRFPTPAAAALTTGLAAVAWSAASGVTSAGASSGPGVRWISPTAQCWTCPGRPNGSCRSSRFYRLLRRWHDPPGAPHHPPMFHPAGTGARSADCTSSPSAAGPGFSFLPRVPAEPSLPSRAVPGPGFTLPPGPGRAPT